MKKVNLGSGDIKNPDWINIDINPGEHIDIVHDLRKSLPFKDNEVDIFYSHHVLEHFSYYELERLLKECLRCLKPNGKFSARLPNLEAIMKNLLTGKYDRKQLMICLYGGEAYDWRPEGAHNHKYGWTPITIRKMFEKVGFKIEKCEAIGSDSSVPVIDINTIKVA